MKKLVLFVLCLAFLAVPASGATGDLIDLELMDGTFDYEAARGMLPFINDLRKEENAWYWNSDDTEKVWATGLQPIQYDYGLERAAMLRAAEVAIKFDQVRPDGSSNKTIMTEVSVFGENRTCGISLTPQVAFESLAGETKPRGEQAPRRNMLREDALYVGVGCYVDNGVYYWVQEFSTEPTGMADNQHYADPVTITSLEENIAHMTGPEDLLMNLGESMALSEIRPKLTMPGHKLLYVCPLIPDMTWSGGDPAVAEVSGNQLVARGLGQTTITGTVGDLSVTAEIIVRESAPEFDVHIDGAVFYSDTEKVITVTIPEVADAVKYEVWFDRLGVGESKYYYEKTEPGEYYWKLLPETNGQPAHYVITAMAKDAENHVIASCERRALLYPTTGLMTLPEDLETLEAQALAGTSPTCVVVPEGCSSIGAGAFSGCGDLASVRVPASVTSIAADAFSGCPAHMVIVAPSGSAASEAAESMGFKWFEFDD